MKKITITIVQSEIITNPPQPGQMKLEIEGMVSVEAVMLLLSAASQIASIDFPPVIKAMEKTAVINSGMGIVGKA